MASKKNYDNTNSGVAFKNKERRNDKDPDLRGTINVDGTDYWLSVWKNTHEEHGVYLKLAVNVKEEKPWPSPTQKKAPTKEADFDDDLNF